MVRRSRFDTSGISAADYQDRINRAMDEESVQTQIVEAARRAGFDLIYHTWNSQHSESGFPDLLMIHRTGRLVVIECKREGKEPTPAQTSWLEGFALLHRYTWTCDYDYHPPWVKVFDIAKPSNRQDIIDELSRYSDLTN